MNNKLIRVYIAGPLRNPDPKIQADNIEKAKQVAILFWNAGFNVYSPHLNSGRLIGLIDEKIALKACLEELEKSDVIFFLDGWQDSLGSRDEWIKADKHKIYMTFQNVVTRDMLERYIDGIKRTLKQGEK